MAELVPALLRATAEVLAIHREETGADPLDVVQTLQAHHEASAGELRSRGQSLVAAPTGFTRVADRA